MSECQRFSPSLASLRNPNTQRFHSGACSNDGLWAVSGDEEVQSWPREKNQKRGKLLRVNAVGGFSEPIYEALFQDGSLLIAIVTQILADHFPNSLHDRILEAVGLNRH
ncbi:MAG: hypothetical protein HY267_05055 [Deltaproteobacteria bacterium]|nr:hypothetical protein [Deltaproteobacteria bacterium]